MIIALSGNDGSGKTTIAKELEKIFEELGFNVVYKHEYEYVFLKLLFKIIGKTRLEESRKEMIVEKRKSGKYYIWPFLVWFDIFLQYLYFRVFKRKSIVILDRYPYDHYMSFEYLGYLNRFSVWLYLHFPKSDVPIILWVEPEIAYERKKDTHSYSLEFYKHQTKGYLNLSNRLRMPSISSNSTINETIVKTLGTLYRNKKARRFIIRKGLQNRVFFDRFRRFRSSLFFDEFRDLYAEKISKLKKSSKVIKNLFDNKNIKYAIIKTHDQFGWIGNDIDVLIRKEELAKIRSILKNRGLKERHGIKEVKESPSHINNMDIVIKDGLNIDIHTEIEWRGTRLINTKEIFENITQKVIFGERHPSVSNEINSIIYALSHTFEKGYISYDEYLFVSKFLDNSFKKYPRISEYLIDYKDLINNLDSKKTSFPYFLPFPFILKWLLKIDNQSSFSGKIRALSLIIFWRIRFRLKNKLPFEVYQ